SCLLNLFYICVIVSCTLFFFIFFFFSSRRRHTRSDRDWSSDVCSSDLLLAGDLITVHSTVIEVKDRSIKFAHEMRKLDADEVARSEERRVGKECRSRWSRYH